jgi:hypothetical protein
MLDAVKKPLDHHVRCAIAVDSHLAVAAPASYRRSSAIAFIALPSFGLAFGISPSILDR